MQAAFGLHTDKAEELKSGDEEDRYLSVLFTVIFRLDSGSNNSAFTVLGYEPAALSAPGAAHAFMSCMFHHTSCVGGRKIAIFIGYPFPGAGEARLRRFKSE